MNGTIIDAEVTRTEVDSRASHGLPTMFLASDPDIDDPVNDTGLGPRRGDLQLSEEFACILSVLVGDGEESFS